jgi:hypothetical protein
MAGIGGRGKLGKGFNTEDTEDTEKCGEKRREHGERKVVEE